MKHKQTAGHTRGNTSHFIFCVVVKGHGNYTKSRDFFFLSGIPTFCPTNCELYIDALIIGSGQFGDTTKFVQIKGKNLTVAVKIPEKQSLVKNYDQIR